MADATLAAGSREISSRTSEGVSTSGSRCGSIRRGYRARTRARHCGPSTRASAVMRGSWRVQSAFIVTIVAIGEGLDDLEVVERGALVHLAGHAPGRGEVHEHRPCPIATRSLHLFRRPFLPRIVLRHRPRPRSPGELGTATTMPTATKTAAIVERQMPDEYARAPLQPRADRDQHESREERQHRVVARLRAQHPREPRDGRVEREREDLLERLHPRARPRQAAQQRREEASSRTGSAMPRPSIANTASECSASCVSVKPTAAPMNGAVHGVATRVASTPARNASA